jgi:uncharacterized membrane protein (DUF2068 family)
MNSKSSSVLRLIAVFKFFKAASLIVIGVVSLKMVHGDVADALAEWAGKIGLNPGNRFVEQALSKAGNISPDRIKELGIVSFVYAALFLTEGTGLWLEARWAEWFTVIITSSLVPLEVYELVRHVTVVKIVVLIINIGVVVYLLYRIRSERAKGR